MTVLQNEAAEMMLTSTILVLGLVAIWAALSPVDATMRV